MSNELVLTLSCDDRPGITARVTGLITEQRGNILEAQQFNDQLGNRFFMRVAFDADGTSLEAFKGAFEPVAREFAMTWAVRDPHGPRKVVMMVSKFDHCLGDLLYRHRIGELNFETVAIISNHPREALSISPAYDVPYHHLPVTKDSKPQQEAQVKRIIEETGAELVVLARYMQILSDDLAGVLSGRCINIHHSFLPGF